MAKSKATKSNTSVQKRREVLGVTKTEHSWGDVYRGTRNQLVAAGLAKVSQFKGGCHYFHAFEYDDGMAEVCVGVSKEEQVRRKMGEKYREPFELSNTGNEIKDAIHTMLTIEDLVKEGGSIPESITDPSLIDFAMKQAAEAKRNKQQLKARRKEVPIFKDSGFDGFMATVLDEKSKAKGTRVRKGGVHE